MLVEGLAEKTTETNKQKDRADKRLEGFFDQVFELTAFPRWLCAYTMTLCLHKLHFQQCLSLVPWALMKKWGR